MNCLSSIAAWPRGITRLKPFSLARFVAASLLFIAAVRGDAAQTQELIPKSGRGAAPRNARGNGPWATRIMLAISSNGLDFARVHFVLSDQAGVPNVLSDGERRARIYYVDFGNGNVLACAVQKESGNLTNWTYRRVRIAGLPEQQASAPVDPCVVLDGEGRCRLYYIQSAPLPSLYSAISSNGFDFVKEPGERFAAAPLPCFDPTVVRTKDEWLLWCGPDGKFAARSTDGLRFESAHEFRVDGVRFMPWSAVALPNGDGCRLFGNFIGPGEWSGGVSSVFSRNNHDWKREPGIRLSLDGSRYRLESQVAPDNGCALLPNGTWLMAYLATIPEPRGR